MRTRYDGQVRVRETNDANERCERTYACDVMECSSGAVWHEAACGHQSEVGEINSRLTFAAYERGGVQCHKFVLALGHGRGQVSVPLQGEGNDVSLAI